MARKITAADLCPLHGPMVDADLVPVRRLVISNRPMGEAFLGMMLRWMTEATSFNAWASDVSLARIAYNPATWTFEIDVANPDYGVPTVMAIRPDWQTGCRCGPALNTNDPPNPEDAPV